MSGPEITTVTLPCIRDGDVIYVLRKEKCLIKIDIKDLRKPIDQDLIKTIEKHSKRWTWSRSFGAMKTNLRQKERLAKVDEWQRWAMTKIVSIRNRKYLETEGKRSPFTRKTRPNWQASIRLMADQLRRRREKAIRGKWVQWSETTSKNTNRRKGVKWQRQLNKKSCEI